MSFTQPDLPWHLLGLKLGPSPGGGVELVDTIEGSYSAKLSAGAMRRGLTNLQPGFTLLQIGDLDVSGLSFEEVTGHPPSVVVKMAGEVEFKRFLADGLGACEQCLRAALTDRKHCEGVDMLPPSMLLLLLLLLLGPADAKEKFTYETLPPEMLGVRTPTIYGCWADATVSVLTIVMEDLSWRAEECGGPLSALLQVRA